jgi:excisionase family DNA binding protein
MQSNDARPLLYSPNAAAHALNVSRSKIYELIKNGALSYVMIGADRRIPANEIQRIAAEGAPAREAA